MLLSCEWKLLHESVICVMKVKRSAHNNSGHLESFLTYTSKIWFVNVVNFALRRRRVIKSAEKQ